MKAYKWFFLIVWAGVLAGCSGTSEQQLVGDWQRRAVFPGSERSHAATFVMGTKGYVVGGYNGTNTLRREVYEFDYTGGSGQGVWKQLPSTPDEMIARQQAVGFALHQSDGDYGYVGAGYGWFSTTGNAKDADWTTLKDFWQYNIKDGTWKQVAPLPDQYEGVEGKARRGAIAFALQVGSKWYGYVGCGYTGDPDRENRTDFWRFDPELTTPNPDGGTWIGKWTPVQGYGGSKRTGASVFIIDNKAYICNGETNTSVNDFWRFDPNNNSEPWIGSPKKLRTMANVNPDEDYDDDYGSLARAYGVAYVVPVGGQLRGHIVGGNKNGSANWEYDHNADLWVQRTSFYNNQSKSNREGMISFSFPDAGKAFVGLGKAGSAYYDDLWEFIPSIDDDIYSDLFQ